MVVGGGIAAVGVGATSAALESMAGSCSQPRGPDGVCRSSSNKPTSASVGVPIALGGLGIAFLGVVVMAARTEQSSPSSSRKLADPAPPENAVALDKTEAVAMAVAHLLVAGIDDDARRPKPLRVDDTVTSLRCQGPHAELQNLRILTAADKTWRTLCARYEYVNEWELTSLDMSPVCTP